MEHTEGKWVIYYDGAIYAEGKHDKMICSGLGFESFKEFTDNKESKANARLIAAAPKLLEIVQEILPSVKCLRGSEVIHREWINRADALVAKVKGTALREWH